jgi:hypothetical protein
LQGRRTLSNGETAGPVALLFDIGSRDLRHPLCLHPAKSIDGRLLIADLWGESTLIEFSLPPMSCHSASAISWPIAVTFSAEMTSQLIETSHPVHSANTLGPSSFFCHV